MRKRENHTVWCTYTFVSIGMLAAVQLLLSRFLSIPVGGFGRISLSPIATMMAGLWLGPLAGGLTGLIADILGCLIQGYTVNPIITLSAVMWGVIPALFIPEGGKKGEKDPDAQHFRHSDGCCMFSWTYDSRTCPDQWV